MRLWRVGVLFVLFACGGKIAPEDTFGSDTAGGTKKKTGPTTGDDDDDYSKGKKGSSSGYGSTSSSGVYGSTSGYPSSSGVYGTSGYSSSSSSSTGGYPYIDAGSPYADGGVSSSGGTPYCPAASVKCGAWNNGETIWICSVASKEAGMTCSYPLGAPYAKCSCDDAGTAPFTIDIGDVEPDIILKYWMGYCGGHCY